MKKLSNAKNRKLIHIKLRLSTLASLEENKLTEQVTSTTYKTSIRKKGIQRNIYSSLQRTTIYTTMIPLLYPIKEYNQHSPAKNKSPKDLINIFYSITNPETIFKSIKSNKKD